MNANVAIQVLPNVTDDAEVVRIVDEVLDYSKINLISTSVEDIKAALSSNIDSVWIYYAWDGIACELQGLDTNFFYFKDYSPELDDYSPVIIANNDFHKNNSEVAKKFMAALSKGYDYAIDQKRWDAFYGWVYDNGLCKIDIPDGFDFSNDYLPE